MYTAYFGLHDNPFAITPDPRFLFLSTRHAEALAHLLYGVTGSGGFIQLTGEVGTGKTTLVRSLLEQTPGEVDVALVINPRLSREEFLQAVCQELRVEAPGDSAKAMVDALNACLLAAHAHGRRTVLIVDEAQNLAADVLEQVRLLTNLETARQKLLQIILIGQPELRDTLARQDLRQLAQRITARYHLEPLSRGEVGEYVQHRLKVAGAVAPIFTAGAVRALYRYSRGVPRLINILADRALLGAYTRELRQISGATVHRAAREVFGPRGGAWRRYALPAGAAALLAVSVAAWSWYGAANRPHAPAADEVTIAASRQAPAVAQPVPEPVALFENPAYRTDTDSAFARLFALWGERYAPLSGVPACEQAAALGLRCLYQRGTWNNLRTLDHPAIITLLDERGIQRHAVITALKDDDATLAFGDRTLTLPISRLDTHWYGEFLLLWRPPVKRTLALGHRGEDVSWLRARLAELQDGVAPENPPAVFDAELEERVRRFQQTQLLRVDGIAGSLTLLHLNNATGAENVPTLTPGG